MIQARRAGRPIFYVDETFLYAHEQNAREWMDANNYARKRGASGGSGKGGRYVSLKITATYKTYNINTKITCYGKFKP